MIDGMLDDLRHAARGLIARPAFFLSAVLTLTLGIGAMAAVFTVYDAVFLKPLPFADADRIVRVTRETGQLQQGTVSVPVFDEWRDRSKAAFDAIGGWYPETMNLAGVDAAQRLSVHRVTPGFWDVFGQPLALGRSFGEQEENHAQRVVVLGAGLWRSRFNASSDIVGRDIRLNGETYRVIGIARDDFDYPQRAQAWIPTFTPGNAQNRRNASFLRVVARLRDGVSVQEALGVMKPITDWQAATFPDHAGGMNAVLASLQESIGAPVRQPLGMLLVAAGLVLLIACANLANLMLARGQSRQQELALRGVLGARRGRLIRHVMAEALLVSVAGVVAGFAIAGPAVAGLGALAPDILPAYNLPAIDLRVVGAITSMALTTIAVFALVPAWRTTSVDPAGALRGAAGGHTDSRGQMRARTALVSTEIALAITLLAGAGLLIDSLRRLADVDTGIESLQEVLTAQFSIDTLALKPGMDLDTWAANAMQQLGPRLAAIENRLGEIPNVDSVALSFGLPASGIADWSSGFRVVGQPDLHESVQYRFVSRDYFRTFGIPVEAGRAFNALDGTRALLPTEMLVNRAFADRYLAGRDPLASEIRTFGDAPIPVIGVVGDVRQAGLDHAAHPEVYFPVSKALKGELSIALKVQGDAMRFAEPLRRAMHEVAPDAPVYEVRTMDSVVGATLALRRFNVTLMGIFAALALVLAATGLYGVVAYAVGARRREIGLRQALGANASAIGRLVLRTGMAMIVPGIIVGLLGALALGRVIAAQLYGVGAHDPLVLGAVVLFLSLAAFAACAIPTLRATLIAPMEVLRNE